MIGQRRTARCRIAEARRGRAWLLAAFSIACGGSITATDLSAPDVVDIVVAPLTANVVVGGTLPLQATMRDASGQAITGPTLLWSVQDTSIATVSPAGVVTARAVGGTQVAASAVTTPEASTVATLSLLLAHTTARPPRGPPDAS